MKNWFIIIAMSVFTTVAFAQSENGPKITFDESLVDEKGLAAYDYGTILQYSDGSAEVKIYNTGNQPLVLSRVRSSCGCTVPSWPRQPIMPGKSAIIKVKYDTKKTGPFNKSITIVSNASKQSICRIKGKVITEAEAAMPILHGTEGATPASKQK